MSVQPGTVMRVVLHFTQPNQSNALNVSHVIYAGTNASSEEDVMTDLQWLFIGNFWWSLRAVIASPVRLFTMAVSELELVGNQWEVVRPIGETLIDTPGAHTADIVDQRVAILARQPINRARTEGKKYLVGVSEPNETGGLINSNVAAAVLAAMPFITLPFGFGAGGERIYVPGVASNTAGNFFHFIGDVVVPTLTANQVRRKVGRGF